MMNKSLNVDIIKQRIKDTVPDGLFNKISNISKEISNLNVDVNISDICIKSYCDHTYDPVYNPSIYRVNNLFMDILLQTNLGKKFPFVGYITKEGKIYECEACQHEYIIRWIVLDDYLDEYMATCAADYDTKPYGMLQEDYFVMKFLGFVKVLSFENTPQEKVLFRYSDLTPEQSAIIYPT